ncbi:MAG: CooT family nickel-binding protein [bacterium]|nr:CooT family nickel-binding protein [bacterium]
MCDTNLYVVRKGQEKLFMENIDVIRREGDDFTLRDIFGEEKSLKARFVETNLLKHRVVLEEIP